METSETSTSIEQVINKIGQVLINKNPKLFKNDSNTKQQIQLLQKKQKNLHLLYVKEQLKVDQLQSEIAEIQEINSIGGGDSSQNTIILKDSNLEDIQSDIKQMRTDVDNNNRQQELYEQQIDEAKAYLEKAKQDINSKYDNLSHFEVELESCGQQLEFLKNQCDDKIKDWERIRSETKLKEKYGEELKAKIKQKEIEIEKERESCNKNAIQIQLYDQLETRLVEQIEVNQQKTDDLLNVNKVLEQKLSEISEQPHELKKLLKVANQMLKDKNQLLEQQIQKIQKLQQTVSISQINSSQKLRSISQFSDMQSELSSQQQNSGQK